MAKKTSVKSKGQKRRAAKAGKGRKAAATRTPRAKAKNLRAKAKKKTGPSRAAKARKAVKKTAPARKQASRRAAKTRKAGPARKAAARKAPSRTATTRQAPARKAPVRPKAGPIPRQGGTGRESELDQTPETGRSVQGRTNPMKTVRSTGTPAGAGDSRSAPGLDRQRRKLRDIEETVQGPPSSLDLDRTPSAARSGRRRMQEAIDDSNETGPVLTGGDVDADWSDAYAVGDEAPGGDNPTPDQDIVDEIGKALGVEYQDNEELKGADKIAERDRHRWELDPASSDDYKDRE
jgi:hypothetical protein